MDGSTVTIGTNTSQDFHTSDMYQKGAMGEMLVRSLLKNAGVFVIPSSDYHPDGGGAPMAQGRDDRIVLPDIDAMKDGHRFWVEVKTRKHASYTRCTGRLEHGFPLVDYGHYQRIQREAGATIYICIYEVSTGDVLVASIDRLDEVKRIYTGNKMNHGGMVFFPRSSFKVWKNISSF